MILLTVCIISYGKVVGLFLPAFFADERHEGKIISSGFNHLIALSMENTHLLGFGIADRDNQSSVIGELFEIQNVRQPLPN
jgi:hypothetical protein